MADLLVTFARDVARRRFEWGEHDCLLMLADWAEVRTGADPAKGWRGHYRTRIGALRIISRAGGISSLVGRALAKVGAVPVTDTRRGDIAVTRGPEGLAGALVLGGVVMQLLPRGVMVRALPIVAAWRV